ncbi:MAG: SIMPL domain-containing protein, partial [Hyphomonadaceae bacterium]|nr:SIMPL domain-containing protein [Hyphomonadaceae bacterium]
AVVKGGGNTINGVSFSIDQPDKFQNDARVDAIKDAAAKAELYAQAVGYKVKRIVTISEQDYYPQPVPMMMQMRMQDSAAEATPVAAGEVTLTQTVNVVFELTK